MRQNPIIKPLLFVLLFCITTNLFSQSEDQNYVLTRVMQDENGALFIDKIAYFDGLGRPVQTVMKGASPSGKDIVTLQEYDQAGRAWRNWQPAPTGESGAYVHTDVFQSTASGFYADSHPYSETIYEPTPLNRVKEQYGPGKDWHDNGKRVINNWFTNNASDKKCLSYQVASSGGLVCNGFYPDAQLYVSEVIDEDGNKSYTFTDKRERVVLTRQIDMGQNYDTYYVYDDIEHLRYVLPPLASDALTANDIIWNMESNDALRQYAYYYQYDERGNCILKKIPGREAIWMVYDKAERLVLSQDGNQRSRNGWTVNKYDPLGRLAYTAEITDHTPWQTLLNSFKDWLVIETFSTQGHQNPMLDTGYSRNFYHNASTQLLTVNYYNDYAFLDLLTPETKAALAYNPMPEYDSPHPRATGMLTGTRVYSLHSGQYTAEALYYDQRANVVQSRATNHLGGYDIAYHQYNFVGNIGKSLKVHSAKSQPTTTLCYTYQYDNAARLTHTYYKLNNDAPLLLAKNEYDEIGRLHRKKRHNEADTEQFDYNVRGWTTRIQSGAFEENIYYTHTGDYSQAAPRYNGNISAVSWTEKNNINAYAYTYDALNRLTRSECYLGGVLQSSGKMEESFTYDKHGNITCLKRGARDGVIDHLQIKYQGNRVESITDWAISTNLYLLKEYRENSRSKAKFRYDGNGNTTSDLDRQIVTIRYNLLNLPDMIQFKNGSQIVNRYDALGRKLETRFVTFVGDISVPVGEVSSWLHGVAILLKENVTQYCGDYEYTYSQANNIMEKPSLSKIHNPEGYKDGRDLKSDVLHYYRRDHLGNVREVWRGPVGTGLQTDPTKQRTQYYPSGLPWAGGIGADYQNRKYNGKEFVEMHGYDTYDYGARGMYPAIMRFMSIDPLAEKYYSVSPYAYCGNNPVRFIDPTGMEIEEGSLKEWEKLKQKVEKQRDKLQSDINKLNAKAEAKGWSSEKLAGKIGNKAERLASLNSSIGTMGTLEGSTQVYSLSHTGYGENGGVTLNTSTNIVDIKFGGTANFVHEMTHAGQFETGDVAFSNTGMSLLQDVYDETAAYKAQFGYSPSSVSGLTSTSVANSFGAITPAWVQGLRDATGSMPYAVGGSANTGLIPININSTRDALIQAYPWNAAAFRGLPANYNIRTLQGIYYKR